MRELNNTEIANVSGGCFSSIGESIAKAIGSAVSDNIIDAAGLLGKGIGNIFEFNVVDAITNMAAGIRRIVAWFTGAE